MQLTRSIKYIVFHHSATPDSMQFADALEKVDISHKKMCHPSPNQYGYHVAHHYLIHSSGSFLKTRSRNEVGYHANNVYANQHSISICFIGNYVSAKLTEKQYQAAVMIVSELRTAFPDIQLLKHSDLFDIACPGEGVDIEKIYQESTNIVQKYQINVGVGEKSKNRLGSDDTINTVSPDYELQDGKKNSETVSIDTILSLRTKDKKRKRIYQNGLLGVVVLYLTTLLFYSYTAAAGVLDFYRGGLLFFSIIIAIVSGIFLFQIAQHS